MGTEFSFCALISHYLKVFVAGNGVGRSAVGVLGDSVVTFALAGAARLVGSHPV